MLMYSEEGKLEVDAKWMGCVLYLGCIIHGR